MCHQAPSVYSAGSGTNNFHLVVSGADLNLYNNGTLEASRPPVNTNSVQISGGTDNTLALDYSGGDFTIPVTFDGGSGSVRPFRHARRRHVHQR